VGAGSARTSAGMMVENRMGVNISVKWADGPSAEMLKRFTITLDWDGGWICMCTHTSDTNNPKSGRQ
jgi:hypothetical protein